MANSLKEIFDNNYSRLCNYASAIVRDRHIAEDVVQTVFIALWENKQLLQLESPEPYLLRCVRFKSIDYLRSQTRNKEISTAILPEMVVNDEPTIEDVDILALLHYFADQLPPKMKRVFLLSRQHGLSYQEIAEELTISIKTVENQMGAALKKLRIILKGHNYLPNAIILAFLFQN